MIDRYTISYASNVHYPPMHRLIILIVSISIESTVPLLIKDVRMVFCKVASEFLTFQMIGVLSVSSDILVDLVGSQSVRARVKAIL